MNPSDFIELAMRLSRGGSEADFRTSISRAYYGCFHAAAQVLVEAGIAIPVGPESHNKVRFCLMESGELAAVRAGGQLNTLRKQRNIADYDLRNTDNKHAHNAAAQVIVARDVLSLLQACRQEPVLTRFRTKVRDYAANVLRLPVT